jgi:hypothetical protein
VVKLGYSSSELTALAKEEINRLSHNDIVICCGSDDYEFCMALWNI